MIAKAQAKYLRQSSMKMRQVIDVLRGKDILTCHALLAQINKGSVDAVKKVLDSAVSNAKQKGLTEDQLFISKITADGATSWKRFRAAAFGRATPILKRTTHLTIELDLLTFGPKNKKSI